MFFDVRILTGSACISELFAKLFVVITSTGS